MMNTLKKYNTDFAFASCRIIDAEDNPYEYIIVNRNSPKTIIIVENVYKREDSRSTIIS